MKYLVLLGDGMSDLPLPEFDNKTPLEIARIPTINHLAKKGLLGMVRTVPEGYPPGSDVANLSVMGYDPHHYYTGRSPLEAASIGVNLLDGDVTFRCNLVNLSDDAVYENKTMVDYSSGEISTEESSILIKTIQEHFGTDILNFYAGVSYRHLLVYHGSFAEYKLTPPHDITDKKITEYLPNIPKFTEMMKESYHILMEHPVNKKRIAMGLLPANSIWLWGEGTKPTLPSFKSKYGLNGSVISAVDLVKGIGLCAKMKVVEVENVTGTIDTNWEGKAKAAVEEFKNGADFVYLHFEAPDECGHHGDALNKIKSIEYLDNKVLKYIIARLCELKYEYSILITPDHPTPVSLKTHTRDAVPFLIYRSNDEKFNAANEYSERNAKNSSNYISDGHTLIDILISNEHN